jgi:hypothetical protein
VGDCERGIVEGWSYLDYFATDVPACSRILQERLAELRRGFELLADRVGTTVRP